MHFWVSQARDSLLKGLFGSTVPKNIGLNWFIPALAKSRVGSLTGTTGLDGQLTCPFPSKNLMKVSRTRFAGHCSSTCGMAAAAPRGGFAQGDCCGCVDRSGTESRRGGEEWNRETIGGGETEKAERVAARFEGEREARRVRAMEVLLRRLQRKLIHFSPVMARRN